MGNPVVKAAKRAKESRRDGISYCQRATGIQARVWDPRSRRHKSRTWPTKEAAEIWAKDMSAKLTLKIETVGKLSLATVGESYAMHRENAGRAKTHVAAIRNVVGRAVAAGLTDMKDEYLPDVCQAWLHRLEARRSGQKKGTPAKDRTKNKILVILRSVGAYAVLRKKILYNPFESVEMVKEKKVIRPTFSISDMRELVSNAHADDPAFVLVALAVYTGQRSETLRLMTWGMIDWNRCRIVIPSEILKQDLPVRAPLQPELADLLRPIAGIGTATIVPLGTAIDSDRANRVFQRYLGTCGIPYENRGLHALRHSCASLLVAAGMQPGSVMDAIGHTQTQTAKHYQGGAQDYSDQVRAEGWKDEGVFFLRRDPPIPKSSPVQVVNPWRAVAT